MEHLRLAAVVVAGMILFPVVLTEEHLKAFWIQTKEKTKLLFGTLLEITFWLFLGVSVCVFLLLCCFGFTAHYLLRVVDSLGDE